jgi:hypothetical protein
MNHEHGAFRIRVLLIRIGPDLENKAGTELET